MKQNKRKFIVIAVMVLLLGLVLAMSGTTFAKYITTKEVPATQATVAKWGMVINANTNDMFATDYTKDGGAYAVKSNTDGVAVNAASAAVAPGTTGSMTVNVNGVAEVKSKISFVVTDTQAIELKSLNSTNVGYQPILWSVSINNEGVVSNPAEAQDKSLTEIVAYLNALTETNAAGSTVNYQITISWEWAFEGVGEANNYDTILANAAFLNSAKTSYTNSEGLVDSTGTAVAAELNCILEFGLKVTVEQIQ